MSITKEYLTKQLNAFVKHLAPVIREGIETRVAPLKEKAKSLEDTVEFLEERIRKLEKRMKKIEGK